MLDIKYLRENIEQVKQSTRNKNCVIDFDLFLVLDEQRRKVIQKVEQLKATQNKSNDEMAQLRKEGKDFSEHVARLKEMSNTIKSFDLELSHTQKKITELMAMIPNVHHESVPLGGEEKNTIVREWGNKPTFSFAAKDHLVLAEQQGTIIDMARAAKITGSGFVLFKGFAARLERALINFMLDVHTKKHGYIEISPPFIVNRDSMFGTGQLPKLEDDMYALKDEDFFLIPTAEVPVTNIHRDEIISEDALPIKYVAYTPCFRREAGSYGKETRGLSRVHQFDKVEMVQFVKPETSFDVLEELVNDAEMILQELNIPYRVVELATGDLSFAASKCYDIEIWAPGAEKWLEVSSCSNFCDFQARRANTRYKSKQTGKTQLVHTLNGSGVALARLVICLLENYQNADGTITVPKALAPYM